MNPQSGTTRPTPFNSTQWQALATEALDIWSPRELARLRFLRWLYRTGRLGIGHYAPAQYASR